MLICKQIAGIVKKCKQTAVIHNLQCKQTANVYNLKCKQIAGIAKNISKQLTQNHIHWQIVNK